MISQANVVSWGWEAESKSASIFGGPPPGAWPGQVAPSQAQRGGLWDSESCRECCLLKFRLVSPPNPATSPLSLYLPPPQNLAQQPGWPETRRKMPPPLLLTRPRNTADNHSESCDRVSALERNTTSSWEFKRKGKIENSASQAFSVEDTGLNPGIISGGYRREGTSE